MIISLRKDAVDLPPPSIGEEIPPEFRPINAEAREVRDGYRFVCRREPDGLFFYVERVEEFCLVAVLLRSADFNAAWRYFHFPDDPPAAPV